MIEGPAGPRRLDARALVDLLLAEGLLSPAASIAPDLRVTDMSRRNVNWLVRSGDTGWFAKMPRDAQALATLAQEAAVLGELHRSSPSWLRSCLPRIALAAPDAGLLVLHLAGRGVTQREQVARHRKLSARRFKGLGRAMGELHAMPWAGPAAAPPWILSYHQPPLAMLEMASEAHLQLLAAVQEAPAIGAALEALATTWQTRCLTHGDLKADNLVVDGPDRATILDWELARVGDPAWDLGALLADGLALWLSSMAPGPHSDVEALPATAALPLTRAQPALRALVAGYSRARPDAGGFPFVERAVRCAGARLLQTAHEQLQHAMELSALAVLTLQLASNVLARPREAAAQLFGLRP